MHNMEIYLNSIGVAFADTMQLIMIAMVIQIILMIMLKIIVSILTVMIGPRLTHLIINRLTFVGVMHHELSHALFAVLTGARVTHIELFKPTHNTLGKVEYTTRGNKFIASFQATMISFAPVIMGLTTSYYIVTKEICGCEILWHKAVAIYVTASILINSVMSKQDIKNALQGLPFSIVVITVVIFTLKIMKLVPII